MSWLDCEQQQNRIQEIQAELARVRALADGGLVSRRELDKLQQQEQSAEVELERAKTLLQLYEQIVRELDQRPPNAPHASDAAAGSDPATSGSSQPPGPKR